MRHKVCEECDDSCQSYCLITGEDLPVDLVSEIYLIGAELTFGSKPGPGNNTRVLTQQQWQELRQRLANLHDYLNLKGGNNG